MHQLVDSILGKNTAYTGRYDPSLLYPVPRALLRGELNIGDNVPFTGCDIWNAYELSWLNGRGKPRIAMACFSVAAESANIVESKSIKLYLNSFSQSRFNGDVAEVKAVLEKDLAVSFGGSVVVGLREIEHSPRDVFGSWNAECLDDMDIEVACYSRAPEFLNVAGGRVEEALYSDLLKSNCPITGQPDWASVLITYCGPRIDREGLLRYIVSFRQQGGFHEHCVERIFMDLTERCRPERLSVYARYTRRGGIDINPYRATINVADPTPANFRLARQ